MTNDPEKTPKPNETTESGIDAETQKKLDEAKKKMDPASKTYQMIQEFLRNYKNMNGKERTKELARILIMAGIAKLTHDIKKRIGTDDNEKPDETPEKPAETKDDTKDKPAETAEDTETETSDKRIDPRLVGNVPKDAKAACRHTHKAKEMAEDHGNNAKILEISPNKVKELESVLEFYKKNKTRYDTVAKATNIPGMLICAIHYRESMRFDRYLHCGDRLGSPTEHVPKGILFKKDDWEKAAIHALGGDIVDERGHPSLKKFQDLRKELGLTKDSTDIGAMMAFAERYNGLGYRNMGKQSAYVYAGTNLNPRGRYVADHVFDPNKIDQNLGVASIIMGIQADESGEKLRIGGAKKRPAGPPKPKDTRALAQSEVTPEVEAAAKEALAETAGKPVGTEVRKTVNGKTYVFQRQTHYNRNPDGAPGIGAFEAEPSKNT